MLREPVRLLLPVVVLAAACGGTPRPVADPAGPGPYETASLDDMITVEKTGDTVPVHAVYPNAASGGPYPIVVFGHGFAVPASAYTAYLEHLASFGYVALTVDYPDPLAGPVNNLNDGRDLAAGLDWAAANPTLRGLVDLSHAGVMGHSRGGKAAVLAALEDARFKAVYGIDPVDIPPPAGITCDPVTECPQAFLAISSLKVPTLFVGETLDSGPGGYVCAPASGNYAVFYAHANSPSIQITVNGASHTSFIDDPSCVACQLCQTPTAAPADVLALAHADAVAFFERYLRGEVGEDSYLTGAEAKQRYVASGLATIEQK